MKTYDIPVNWMVTATEQVEAESLAEALWKVGRTPLPDGKYLEESFKVEAGGLIRQYGDEAEKAISLTESEIIFDQ